MKIAVVDDEKSIVNLICMNLEIEGYGYITAYNGHDAIKLIKNERPDLVILDVMLPDIDGFDVLKRIKEYDNTIPVIMLTAKDKLNSKILGLRMGADDYITKPFNTQELILRIKAIFRRVSMVKKETAKASLEEKIIKVDGIEIHKTKAVVYVNGVEINLTYKEFSMLTLFCENEKKVFSRDDLLNRIWGYEYLGNSRAVDIMITRLRQKIAPYGNYIKTVYGIGYKFNSCI